MFEIVKADVLRYYDYASGGRLRRLATCARAPGVRASIVFRYGQWVARRPWSAKLLLMPVYWFLEGRVRSRWGIELQRTAVIGPGLYIGHHGGIVVSGSARIGRNLNISHGVTIGVAGRGEDRGVPVIGDDVYLAPGAKLFGKIHVGDRAVVGANAVIHRSIPAGGVAVLKPGFELLSSGAQGASD